MCGRLFTGDFRSGGGGGDGEVEDGQTRKRGGVSCPGSFMLPCFDITVPSVYGFTIDKSEAEEDPDDPDPAAAPDEILAGRDLEGSLMLLAAGGVSSPESQRLIISHSSGSTL